MKKKKIFSRSRLFLLFILTVLMFCPMSAKAANLTLNQTSVSLVRGETKVLRVKGAGKKVNWVYDKKIIAVRKLNETSIMIAGKTDSAVTEIKAKSGSKAATCTVTITPASDNEIELLGKGEKLTLTASDSLGTIEKASIKTSSVAKVVSVKGKKVTIKGLKPGRTVLTVRTKNSTYIKVIQVIDWGRTGKSKSTQAQYKAWRKKWIRDNIPPDCSDIEAVMYVANWVNQQKYGDHYNGYDLWRYGTGTCVAGAYMVKDFCNDLGISCVVRFAGNDKPPFGIYYASQHYNCLVKIGKKKYHVNATPGTFGGAFSFQVK